MSTNTIRIDPRTKDPEYNLEIGTDTPNIRLILKEIEEVQSACSNYRDRNYEAHQSWHARWPGQSMDARKHRVNQENREEEVFPWEGASDTRIRTVKQQIRDHVTMARFTAKNCKVQAQAVRPFADGQARQQSKVGTLLKWQVATQIRTNLQREYRLAAAWTCGYGAALLHPHWWQCRRLEFHELTIPVLADIVVAQTGMPSVDALMQVTSAIADDAQFDRVVSFIQSLSPIVTRAQARQAVLDLQQMRTTQIPVPYTFRSQPRITALRPGIEVLFRDMTGDLQAEPWIATTEWVSETDLRDRIVTENYDPGFVEQAIQRKGQGSDDIWHQQTLAERGVYGNEYGSAAGWVNAYAGMTQLTHFLYKAHYKGTPAIYWTIFNPAVTGRDLKNPLVARHGLHPYEHGLYPMVPMRFEAEERPIRSSQGIAELAYTWQKEEKIQADGLADRTALVHRPPLVGPITRRNAITGSALPGSYLGVTRPNEFSWMPIPPPDPTPVQVLAAVAKRCEAFFALFGESVDPDLKQMRRAEFAGDRIAELTEMLEQVYFLDQQYLPDGDVSDIVGALQAPFQVSRAEIQGQHHIQILFDPQMVSEDYVMHKMELVGKAMGFNQGGNANMSGLFKIMMELADPDIADSVVDNDQVATDRERQDEKQAFLQMLNGMEPDKPQYANHQLRLQVIQEQLATPGMVQKVQGNEVTAALVKNRVAWHMAQIQQYQQNPQIGRSLTTKTFQPGQAPQLTAPEVGS